MVHIDLDFVMLEATETDAMRDEAQAWVDEHAKAPGVVASIVRTSGPGGGWPEVRLTAPTLDALRPAVVAYDAGNGDVEGLMAYVVA